MLINCPRCGFSQPTDQYCAQCGVDMQSYKPKESPLLTRLVQSTALQISALLIAAVFTAYYVMSGPAPQKLVQKIIRSQGVTKSEKKSNSNYYDSSDETQTDLSADESSTADKPATSATVRESAVGATREQAAAETSGVATVAQNVGNSENSSATLKLSYLEVPLDTINKWVVESSNSGLYQSLADYSVGMLYDFRKRNDNRGQVLKDAELKLNSGAPNTNLSGLMSDDGTQLLGLAATVELKSGEGEALVGNINVTKNSRQGSENYPSEFELPKGSALFIIGTLKIENFQADRARLQMPPFQIFKSNDFMTRKTEFVIVLEPNYK